MSDEAKRVECACGWMPPRAWDVLVSTGGRRQGTCIAASSDEAASAPHGITVTCPTVGCGKRWCAGVDWKGGGESFGWEPA